MPKPRSTLISLDSPLLPLYLMLCAARVSVRLGPSQRPQFRTSPVMDRRPHAGASPHFSPHFVARASRRRSDGVLGPEGGEGRSRHYVEPTGGRTPSQIGTIQYNRQPAHRVSNRTNGHTKEDIQHSGSLLSTHTMTKYYLFQSCSSNNSYMP